MYIKVDDMSELMGSSWEDLDDVPMHAVLHEDLDRLARTARSPSPPADAFAGFDSVVVGNLLRKNEVTLCNNSIFFFLPFNNNVL